ncbi:DUF1002 domain-containing protein [Heyndrickxia sporothermodurans]|uniref:DUF1002 domain-containing protein n=1 Tax=Heyndrickxia sporothermodurans TaxID=46224 RepID=A0AB37HNW2_9BACI|nr:DUF1002 domain-containing protein [Heyndrickxia sporothermodurans]MBL5767253.1 DUF1002 domain-containing protein [Heyndrickxia sporothermodurans]MBL5770788.1 DUF1002 domain-containing protein [Heyndrickxia sporothermodurans]MBL5774419.1 DUF1002 domain-containing protein [Heyndrickxia sporothermodurans]MBL5777966.1 DUF1002 domain-containing protein [Heyndrickxia sporothermodurans]MBL5781544.1 DUF1002 domain-containing protein [Heyndrickxia sporothermodurans]
MLKRISKIVLIAVFMLGIGMNSVAKASSNDNSDSINEKFGLPIVVYGEKLSADQKQKVKELLNVTNSSQVKEVTVTAADLVKYINGDPNSNLYSSAKITRKEKGEGLAISIVTPDNITEVTDQMYANALLTAGVEDADVEVASPIKVSGHSALVGIYKAYDKGGGDLNKDRMEVANEELGLATDLAKKKGMDQEKVTQLLTEIKEEIAKQKPATKEDIEKIIDDKLKSLNIQLSPEDRELLVKLFDKMRNLDINFDNVKSQLGDIAKDIKKKLQDATGDKGFWQGVADFFKKIFQAIADFFGSLF